MTQQDVIINKSYYKVYEKIGVGDTTGSVILRAREATSLGFVAYKKINIRNEQTKQSILKQIKYFKQLDHKNIVQLKDQSMDKSEQNIYLFFEILQQQTLDQIVRSDKSMPSFTISIFAQDIRDLLIYVHGRQVLLNDLHSKNILPTVDGVLKFIDFEQAGSFKQVTLTQNKIDNSIYKCGYAHRAPETLIEGGVYSTASDIYMFGQIVYFIAYGFYPYQEEIEHFKDTKTFAEHLIAQDENIVIKALQQQPLVDHKQITPELLTFLYETIQPLPFKRSQWNELQKLSFLELKDQRFKIQENVQGIYFQFLNQACQNNIFGQQYINLRFDVHTGNANSPNLIQRKNIYENQQNGDVVTSNQLFKSSTAPHSHQEGAQAQRQSETTVPVKQPKTPEENKLVHLSALKNIYQLVNTQYESIIEHITVQNQVKIQPSFYNTFIQIYLQGRIQQYSSKPVILPLSIQDKVKQPQDPLSLDEIIKNHTIQQNNQVGNDVIFDNLWYISSSNKNNIEQINKLFEYCHQQLSNNHNQTKIYQILTYLVDNNFNTVIQLVVRQKIELFHHLLTSLQSSIMVSQHHYSIYTQILQVFIIAFSQQLYKYSDFQTNYQIEFNNYLRKYIEQSDEKFTESYNNIDSETMLSQLSQIQVYYIFCNNIISQILFQEQQAIDSFDKQSQRGQAQQYSDSIVDNFSLTPLLVTGQNIYMQLHQDQVQASIRQHGHIQLLKNITKLTTRSFKLMTDIRLQSYIDIKYVKVSNFDFTRISNHQEKEVIADIMYALANISFLEHYAKLDFYTFNHVKRSNQQNTKASDIYILNNKNQLFQLIDYNTDLKIIDSIGTLLFSLILNDSFLESILKNPLNIKNHKLYRFSKLDNDIIGKIDQVLQKAANSTNNSIIVQTAANIVTIIQIIMDIASFSIKQYSIAGAYINIKFYSKCYNCLEFLDIMLKPNVYMRFLQITQRQVQNIESIIFALSNTIYEIKNDANNSFYQQLNMIEFKQFIEISTQLISKYINIPWQQHVYNNLFENVNNKFKGLWYALISLLKCPNYAQIVADQQEKSVQLAETIYIIRQSVPQYFQSSLEKYLENGPVGNNVYTYKQLYKQIQNNATEVLANMPELGLVAGMTFSQEKIVAFQQIAQGAILRLLTSKSMFFQLFSDTNVENILNFLCYVLDVVYDKVPKEILDDYYKIGISYISKQQIYQPKAYELLSILAKNGTQYFLNVCREDIITKALDNMQIGIILIERVCNKFVLIAIQKLENNNGNIDVQLIFNQQENKEIVVKHLRRIIQYLNQISQSVESYVVQPNILTEYVQCCIRILIIMGQLYLYNKGLTQDTIEMVKQLIQKYVNNIQQVYQQSQEFSIQMMDLILCYTQYFKENWKDYQKIKSTIQQFISQNKGKIHQQLLYKFQQINEDKSLVIIPKDLVSE